MIIIRGHSDDAIEITGEFEEIIDCTSGKATLEFEDGTKIIAQYQEKTGYWEMKVKKKGEDFVRIVPPTRFIKSTEVHIENYEYRLT